MNLSGESIRACMDFYKIDPEEELIVIYDDISLAPGKLRVRVGVGEKPADYDLADYVLGHFSAEDQKLMNEAFKEAADAAVVIMTEGLDSSMNQYNGKK